MYYDDINIFNPNIINIIIGKLNQILWKKN